jgi:hypothetical protein
MGDDAAPIKSFADIMARPKGFLEYNPAESFAIHVQWVVASRKAAEEMLEALRTCADCTTRDAPPVLCYFFRISHDQGLAREMREVVKTLGDHPQYKKKFKLAEMGLPAAVVALGCEREGFSGKPFAEGWTADRAMDAELAEELGFDPVVLDLTEVYLDTRAFVDHALSRDYQAAYGVLMQPHRNLAVHTVVSGTPTAAVWDRVLEPSLKARRAVEPECLNLSPEAWAATSDVSGGEYALCDVTFPNASSADDFRRAAAASGSSPFQCVFRCAGTDDLGDDGEEDSQGSDRPHRVIAAVRLTAIRDAAFTAAMEGAVHGRAFLFPESVSAETPLPGPSVGGAESLQQLKEACGRLEVIHAGDRSFSPLLAGFGLSAKVAELKADTTVRCDDIHEM